MSGVSKYLLNNGARINFKSGFRGSVLSAASYNDHKEVVRVLLEKGAEVNAFGGEYGNALSTASYKGHKEVVHLLLEAGADANACGRAVTKRWCDCCEKKTPISMLNTEFPTAFCH